MKGSSVVAAGSLLAMFGLLLLGVNAAIHSECSNSQLPQSCSGPESTLQYHVASFLIFPLIAGGLVIAAIGLVLFIYPYPQNASHLHDVNRETNRKA